MGYMDIQYRIKNPIFLDPIEDWQYFATKVVPWMFQYAAKFKKIEALNIPVEDFLRQYTDNEALVDIIAQHFFTETPPLSLPSPTSSSTWTITIPGAGPAR